MHPKLKPLVLQALRGQGPKQYTQIHDDLHTECGFCSLGVIADVAINYGFVDAMWSKPIDDDMSCTKGAFVLMTGHDYSVCYLGRQIGNAIGLDMSEQRYLSELNDDEGETFEEIADYIEVNL